MNTERTVGDVVYSPGQVIHRIWEQAFEAIVDCPTDQLRYESKSGSHYVISPWVEFLVNSPDGSQVTRRFEVAGLLKSEKGTLAEDDTLYLIVDGVVSAPAMYINKGNISPPFQTVDDGSAVSIEQADTITDKIDSKVKQLVEERQRQRRDTARGRKERRHKRLRTGGIAVVSAFAIAVTGGTIYGANRYFDTKEQQEQAAAEQLITDYDAQGIVLSGTPVGRGDAEHLIEDPDVFTDGVPDFTGEILSSPRKLLVSADEQKQIGQIGEDVTVLGVVEKAPGDNVLIDVHDNGSVWIRALPNEYTDGETTTPVYTVLVQVQ